jgi:dGTPase
MLDIDAIQENHLAPWAMRATQSRGRAHRDHEAPYRGFYQRDRDRIIHCSAFRRLQYKTQVFVSVMEGDYYRNRLTHTLEVTQIARTLARALGLNEDLVEALALAHDLGHGPFGHSGESALEDVMSGRGGFDHNAQGLRIVDVLEQRYTRFSGLNLSYETREGFVKNYVRDGRTGRPRAALGFAADESPSLEVQVVGHADEIAYDTHDLDDGLVSGTLSEDAVRSANLWQKLEVHVTDADRQLLGDSRLRWRAIVRRLIATLTGDLLDETRRRLAERNIQSAEDVRRCDAELAGFSPEMLPRKQELEKFLHLNFYSNPRVKEKTSLWQRRLQQLFEAYRVDLKNLPDDYRRKVECEGESLDRVICDYVAGMTDRYATRQWENLVGK